MQYKTWAHLFHDKRKKQFIPQPWKIGDCIVKHLTHLNELVEHHEKMGLKDVKLIKAFEPYRKFTTYMQLVGYASHFIIIEQFQEGGEDNLYLRELASYQHS
jgi:hypothetical protein